MSKYTQFLIGLFFGALIGVVGYGLLNKAPLCPTEEVTISTLKVISSVRSMSVEECQEACKSPTLSTANTMYVATDTTVFVSRSRGDSTVFLDLIDIYPGDILARSGCGSLDTLRGSSIFMYFDRWGDVPNRDVQHYANPILERAEF